MKRGKRAKVSGRFSLDHLWREDRLVAAKAMVRAGYAPSVAAKLAGVRAAALRGK
jgi:hypothetical protein